MKTSLEAGARLGSYVVSGLVGRGGMGEVYRAHDTKLKRDVAIKILPAEFAHDPERRARFQREAEVLASLNHPNIAAIYGLEEVNETRFLVLEFVEGDTVAERLLQGPLPLSEVLVFALQICDGLVSAHDKGIVHRDLKPANIKITPEGKVKVLDFGLARIFAGDSGPEDASNVPTMTGQSVGGAILGTAAYMAPEQARGKPVDKRADIWALGCVLYEMLTGHQLFSGESLTDILAAVVTKEPDFGKLPPATPSHIRLLLTRCLQKDANVRFRDAGDAAVLLNFTESAGVSATPNRRAWMVSAALSTALLAALIPAILYFRSSVPAAPIVRFEVAGPRTPNAEIAISPDGRRVVYVGDNGNAKNSLWVRSLDSLDAQMLPGTESSRAFMNPFWSPDSRFIGFAADGNKLKKVEATGGPAETIVELAGQFGGGAWNREGTVLFASNGHGLQRVSGSGGAPTPITERDASRDETYHDCPSFLPDGRHFLYLAYSASKPENRALYIGFLGSATRTRLMAADSCATYAAPGYILFFREQTLLARPFNADRLEFTGEAAPIAEGVASIAQGEVGLFAASDAGTLIYRKAVAQSASRRLQWMDRAGKTSSPIGAPLRATFMRLSPDGKRLAFSEGIDGGLDDIWIYDIERDVKLRLTTDPAVDHIPVWSPDGARLVFDSHRGKAPTLYEKPSSGAVPERILLEPEPGIAHAANDWSSDGRLIVFMKGKDGSPPWDLWVLPLFGDRKPFPYIVSPFNESQAALSPNGRWIAYVSDESGKYEVVVQPFPDPSGGKWQISTGGGSYPRWKRDGREIYYLTPSGGMVAVSVATDTKFDIGKSTSLFQTPLAFSGDPAGFPYDVTADGQRFLMSVPGGAATVSPITVVLNWMSAVKR